MDYLTALLNFGLIFAMSAIFGIQRQRSHKPIGFGTFIFVALGSCGLSMVAMIIEPQSPISLLSAIVTSIGFLGAGALIRTSDKIFGFTTAAGIWLFAIIGVLVGIQNYFFALIIYAMMWLVVSIDTLLERKGIGSYQKRITISANKIVNEKEVRDIFAKNSSRYKLISIQIDKAAKSIVFMYLVEGKKEDLSKVTQYLFDKPWFAACKVE